MKKILFKLGFLSIIALFSYTSSYGQCKDFIKKKGLPQLSPYIFNGQMNSALLNEGDIAELILTFYANQDYRILICSEEHLGKVEFKLYDIQNNLLFDNKKYDHAQLWDFTSTATQQIRLELEVPESLNPEIQSRNGCVAILVGFKDK